MASEAYVGSKGVRTSYGGVAALADLGSRLAAKVTASNADGGSDPAR